MHQNYHIEIDCQQKYHDGERICGDVFLFRRIEEENRVIIVLSDGMGHGVKANILATLTATMSMNFTLEHKEVQRIADIIMNTLPAVVATFHRSAWLRVTITPGAISGVVIFSTG